jgi:hypothetical protein
MLGQSEKPTELLAPSHCSKWLDCQEVKIPMSESSTFQDMLFVLSPEKRASGCRE